MTLHSMGLEKETADQSSHVLGPNKRGDEDLNEVHAGLVWSYWCNHGTKNGIGKMESGVGVSLNLC